MVERIEGYAMDLGTATYTVIQDQIVFEEDEGGGV